MTDGKTTVLDELLNDPMVQMVMARDRVQPEDLRRSLERHRASVAGNGATRRSPVPPAHVIAACQARDLCC